MKELIVLAADQQWLAVLESVLERHEALGIRSLEDTYDVRTHPMGRDAGLRSQGPEILRTMRRQYRHGLLVFDHGGCGDPADPLEIQNDLDLKQAK